jgi:hypothetical protein
MIEKILQIKEVILLTKEAVKLLLPYRKIILAILTIVFVVFILLIRCIVNIDSESDLKSEQTWKSIQPGDSIFVKSDVADICFYKKGREKLSDEEQKEIHYRREDSLNFIEQNSVPEKFFYQNRTSFIGICIDKDSTTTEQGIYNNHKWIKVLPSYKIIHPLKSEKYDYESRKWENNDKDFFIVGKLSKGFFVSFKDITNVNNDSTFNR